MKNNRNPWISRYEQVATIGEIRRRTRKDGVPIEGLQNDPIEVACARLTLAIEAIYYPTDRGCEITLGQVERALAHAGSVYADSKAILQRCYEDNPFYDIDSYYPTCITGPAGSGKTQLARATSRLFRDVIQAKLDAEHGPFQLQGYNLVTVRGQKSVSRALRALASPQIASGNARIAETDLPRECSRWSYKTGLCLFGVDELQFMTQSDNASTLVTKTLLSFSEVRVPYHFNANYSLCWKLLRRPQEVRQRIFSRIALLLPDPPHSKDWHNYLNEIQRVASKYFSFNLVERAILLWNLCAGLKRELVKLLVNGYRICRCRGGNVVIWSDIELAYASIEFCDSRRDIEAMIAHAAQGGDLREDLRCPFTEGSISVSQEQYYKSLQAARAAKVAVAARDASMNVDERKAANALISRTEPAKPKDAEKTCKQPRKKRTLENLLESGRQFKERKEIP